jgi:hypothetical protein
MAIRLDRALTVVRRDRAVFEALITNLSSATSSVKLGIQALRQEADRAAEQIERRSDDADKLATDLSFLIDAANRAGARLEQERQSDPAAQPKGQAANWSGATPRDELPAKQAANPAGGLRELVGIAQRRRTRTAGVTVAPRNADRKAAAPEPNEPVESAPARVAPARVAPDRVAMEA